MAIFKATSAYFLAYLCLSSFIILNYCNALQCFDEDTSCEGTSCLTEGPQEKTPTVIDFGPPPHICGQPEIVYSAMKVAIVSDIENNLYSLTASLDYKDRFEAVGVYEQVIEQIKYLDFSKKVPLPKAMARKGGERMTVSGEAHCHLTALVVTLSLPKGLEFTKTFVFRGCVLETFERVCEPKEFASGSLIVNGFNCGCTTDKCNSDPQTAKGKASGIQSEFGALWLYLCAVLVGHFNF